MHNAQNRLSFHSHFGINRNEKNGIPHTKDLRNGLVRTKYLPIQKSNVTNRIQFHSHRHHLLFSNDEIDEKQQKKKYVKLFCIRFCVDIEFIVKTAKCKIHGLSNIFHNYPNGKLSLYAAFRILLWHTLETRRVPINVQNDAASTHTSQFDLIDKH